MVEKHLVSIITPAYNSARFIISTIQSVQLQTYSDWELIIVDDCSKDETCRIVEQFIKLDKRIRLIQLSENSGPANARNVALKAARGRYVAFLDSDDLWLPQKLECQISFMQKKRVVFSYTNYRRMSEKGDKCGKLIELPLTLDYRGMLKNTGIAGCLTVIIDRELTGTFYFPNTSHEDFVLWLSLLKRGITAFGIQEDLARYRIVGSSVSSKKSKSALWVWQIYRNIEGLNLFSSLWCFMNYAWRANSKIKSLKQ